jgi:general secretion pathway protein I
MSRRREQSGFTLLEVLVATVILAVAIAGLMSALSGSMRVAGRLTDYDRAAMLAKRKMEEIIADKRMPRNVLLQGAYDATQTNGAPSGWRVRIAPFEVPPNPAPGNPIVDRIHVQVWWMNGEAERTFDVESFRRYYLTAQDVAGGVLR